MNTKYTESQITELRQYAEFYDLSSIQEAIDYCTKCHFCGRKCEISIHTHSHQYCKMRCADLSEDFNYCCFRGESCKICNNYAICMSKLLCSGYTVEESNKSLSKGKEFTLAYKLGPKITNSQADGAGEIGPLEESTALKTETWSKTISTGKIATVSLVVKYNVFSFIAELSNNDKEIVLVDNYISSNYYNITVEYLGEQISSCTELLDKSSYSQEEIEEIEKYMTNLELHKWNPVFYAKYEILNGCSLKPIITKKYSEVVASK